MRSVGGGSGAGAGAPRTILVTGATGFIGSHVAAALSTLGDRVRVHVRPTSDTRWLDALDVEPRQADLATDEGAQALVAGVDAVVHAAGVTRARSRDAFLNVNTGLTERLAEAAARAGVHRFVLLSSLAARGPDQAEAPGDAPVSWYGASKLLAERALRQVADRHRMGAVALRLGGVYGPRDTDLLPLFQAASWGILPLPPRGLEAQPVHVTDAVEAVLAALERTAEFGPWTVAGASARPWQDFGGMVGEALGRRVATIHVPRFVYLWTARVSELVAGWRGVPPRLDLRRAEDLASFSYTGDIGATLDALGWRPMMSMRDGLIETAAWYRGQGWLR